MEVGERVQFITISEIVAHIHQPIVPVLVDFQNLATADMIKAHLFGTLAFLYRHSVYVKISLSVNVLNITFLDFPPYGFVTIFIFSDE